jgi:enoyl-CoA hydratase/carnithine racemase
VSAQLKSASLDETLILTLSNPSARNALSPDMVSAATEAIQQADASKHIKSIIIQGEGEHFCGGGNVARLLKQTELPPEGQDANLQNLHHWMESVRVCSKPVIAAVEGAAAGGGFSLALNCDFMVAANNAFFVMAYTSIALSSDAGGSWNLARQLPRALCSEILMLGGKVSAQQLAHHGLINELTPPTQALERALALAKRLNARAPNALSSVKALLNQAQVQALSTHLDEERENFLKNLYHPNAKIGLAAFLDKTPPSYDAQ